MAVNSENILCLWSEECKRIRAKVKKLKLDSCSLCSHKAWSRHSYSKARCRAGPDEWIERSLLKGWLMLPFHFSSQNINNLFAAFDFPPLKANNNFTFSFSYRSCSSCRKAKNHLRFSEKCFIDIICKKDCIREKWLISNRRLMLRWTASKPDRSTIAKLN